MLKKKLSIEVKEEVFFSLVVIVFLLFNLKLISFLIILVILVALTINLNRHFKNNNFFIEEVDKESYIFSLQDCDLIKFKASEWALESNRSNLFPNDKLDKLDYFYSDIEQINSSLIPELNIMISPIKSFKKSINLNNDDIFITILVKNLLFLIYLKEKNFGMAYNCLEDLQVLLLDEVFKYIFNQTIDGKKLILLYLLEYKNDNLVDNIIALLFKFNSNIGVKYLESLELSEEDINYCLKMMNENK